MIVVIKFDLYVSPYKNISDDFTVIASLVMPVIEIFEELCTESALQSGSDNCMFKPG